MNIYVASSWRNNAQGDLVRLLRDMGHDVYDFKNPRNGDHGFNWREVDTNWENWTPAQFKESLHHPIAVKGFHSDMNALRACDACVLLLPCGKSAHLELGYAVAAGKRTYVLTSGPLQPELMYAMVTEICTDIHDLMACLS